MSAALLVAVGALGGVGAVGRVLVDRAVMARAPRRFPFGTLVVNLSGSFALGVLVGAALTGDAYRLAATGLLGAYTTFSTWMLESRRLAGGGRPGLAAVNVAGSLVLGVGMVWLGRTVGRGF